VAFLQGLFKKLDSKIYLAFEQLVLAS